MDILQKIVSAKRSEIKRDRKTVPVPALENSEYFILPVSSLEKSLLDSNLNGIIAEFKRKSPSKGLFNSSALPEKVCHDYFRAGASAVSVLTNSEFFGGSSADLAKVRRVSSGPVLRKEFIIDEYQVIESKSIGADAILLIADILSARQMKQFWSLALSLGMEVLFEIHDESGIEKLPGDARLVGINSRNLADFNVDSDIAGRILRKLPRDTVKVAESGIHSAGTVIELRESGFRGFLIGEMFMREADPGNACKELIDKLKKHGL